MSGNFRHAPQVPRLERLLAKQLHYGTWLASAVIACGILLVALHWQPGPGWPALPSGMQVVAAGIGLFILLPVSRVVLMLVVFVHQRDYLFGLIAALVLAIIGLGLLLGLYPPGGA